MQSVPPPEAHLEQSSFKRFWRSSEALLLSGLSIVIVLALWELASANEWVNPTFFSRPSDVWSTFIDEYFTERGIYAHIRATIKIGSRGLLLGLLAGIPVGAVMGAVPRIRYVLEPWITAAYVTPTVALLPLFILWLGIGDSPKILLVFLGAVFPILINTQAGIAGADPALLETARSFRASGLERFRKVSLPAALPFIFAGVRLAIGRTLIMSFVAELFLSNKGLGYYVSDAGAKFRSSEVFVGIITLALLGVAATQIVRFLERRFVHGS